MQKSPFVIDAAVVLPNHLHFIWILPEHDSNYSTRWRFIKTAFTKQCLRDKPNFQQHIDYIHYNLLKHGHVERASNWQYSSIHRYTKLNILNRHWGAVECFY